MKVRINGNSIRLRLSQEEVTDLVKNGTVNDACEFINSRLTYGILSSNGSDISAEYIDNDIKVIIPKSQLENWDTNDQVGFQHTTENGLSILVEKDFKCLKPRAHEDESKLYPNPSASK